MDRSFLIKLLNNHQLKITPQRIAVYEALLQLDHPDADEIAKLVNITNPGIAKGTIYNVLELLCEKNIIRKVKTDEDKMRYDPILSKHHHLYDQKSTKIYDYVDEELDVLLENYFVNKNIKDFSIKEIKLQIVGEKENKNKR